jgi:VWFA-related protein
MRRRFVALAVLVAGTVMQVAHTSAAGQAASTSPSSKPPGQAIPTFRAGTDLLTLDVSVLDRDGRPVEGLTPADFTVKIEGKGRQVVAAELVKADAPAPAEATQFGPLPVTRVETAGRRMLIAVDQQYILPGSIKPLLNAGANFVDRLGPRDQAAFIAFPQPGPHVDFTSDKAKVREAMQGLVGQPSRIDFSLYDIAIAESLTINDRERHFVDVSNAAAPDPPTVADIMERVGCDTGVTDEEKLACRRRIVADSVQIAQQVRLDGKISIRTLESIVDQLAKADGTKIIILVSASLTLVNQQDLDTLIQLAAKARVWFQVIIVDLPVANKNAESSKRITRVRPPTENADRRVVAEGLEELAAEGRGATFRLASNGSGILDRIALEASASYVLGVESKPEDLKGDIGKVEVAVKKPGLRVRVSQAFARPVPPPKKTLEDTLRDALSSSTAYTDLPVRAATFSQWDPGSGKVRVSLAAEVGQPGIQPGDYVVGYILTDRDNQKVAEWSEKQTAAADSTRRTTKPFGEPLLLEPGTYSLHLGIVDAAGHPGTVIREVVVARSMTGTLPTSDLLVGNPPPAGQRLGLGAQPRVNAGRVAAYVELYSAMPEDLDFATIRFEIAKDATSPALAMADGEIQDGPLPAWRIGTGSVDAGTLTPGPYVARAHIMLDDKTLAVVTRPFTIERPRTPVAPAPAN